MASDWAVIVFCKKYATAYWPVCGFLGVLRRMQGPVEVFCELFAYCVLFLFDIFYVFARLRDLDGRAQRLVNSAHNKNL
jgi:hypothetical protein